MTSMVVIGMNILVLPDSIRISPGSLPNQLKAPGAKCKTSPAAIKIIPAMMSHLDIYQSILCKNIYK